MTRSGDGFLKYPYPDLVSYSLKFVSILGTNLVSRFCNIIWSIYVIGKELSDLVQRIPSPSKRNRLVKCCSPFWCKNNIMLFKYEWSLRMGLKFILVSSLISLPFRKFTCFFLIGSFLTTRCKPHASDGPILVIQKIPFHPAFQCRMAINEDIKITLS